MDIGFNISTLCLWEHSCLNCMLGFKFIHNTSWSYSYIPYS